MLSLGLECPPHTLSFTPRNNQFASEPLLTGAPAGEASMTPCTFSCRGALGPHRPLTPCSLYLSPQPRSFSPSSSQEQFLLRRQPTRPSHPTPSRPLAPLPSPVVTLSHSLLISFPALTINPNDLMWLVRLSGRQTRDGVWLAGCVMKRAPGTHSSGRDVGASRGRRREGSTLTHTDDRPHRKPWR